MLAEQYESIRDAHILRNLWTWSRKRSAFFVLGPTVILVTLALAGVPGWRIGVLVMLAAACMGIHSIVPRVVDRPESMYRALVLTYVVVLPLAAIKLGLTGGVTSPLVILYLGIPASAMVIVGPRRGALPVLGLSGLLLAALAFEPASWAGPPILRPYAVALTLESVVLVGLKVGGGLFAMWGANQSAQEELDRLREDALVQLCERARRLQSMSAKVAHELKNPLAAIKGLVQLLERSEKDPRDHERMAVIGSEVGRMEEILRDYLSYSRPFDELKLQPVELAGLAQDVISTLSGRAEAAGVSLRVRDGTGAIARVDRRRLKEAFINLVQNAIEACERGGVVDLEVRRRERQAEVVIVDTGRGIPPDALARLGTPFFTTREDGTGLGVVLARSVVVHHGGSLEFQSHPGRGTRVTLQLPLDLNA
ncbi:MAG TPA: HAMP domain-containing sensor histidine kinase [Polyangia bacterium]|nr:HAMP domain-containing sensor histidine kinase [Polyangia bacterium]